MDSGNKIPANPGLPLDLQVKSRLVDIGRLVSLPNTTFRLLNLLVNENTSAKELQKVVEQDPALAAKVISISNSVLYSVRNPVTTIDRAITIIGFRELETIAMGVGLTDTFDLKNVPTGFDGRALWLHCLAVSWIAKELSVITKIGDKSEVMIGGLLHELGIIILVSKFPVHFHQLFDLVNSGQNLQQAENVLSLRHEIIGYHLACNWGLPPILQDIILYHHSPELSRVDPKVTALVTLADNLAQRVGYGLNIEQVSADVSLILDLLQLKIEKLQAIIKNIINSIGKAEALWTQILNGTKPKDKPKSLASLLK